MASTTKRHHMYLNKVLRNWEEGVSEAAQDLWEADFADYLTELESLRRAYAVAAYYALEEQMVAARRKLVASDNARGLLGFRY